MSNKLYTSKGSSTESSFINVVLASYLPVFFFIFLAVFFYDSYTGSLPLGSLFFKAKEPPWLPGGIQPIALAGQHYFGDFQLPWVMANQSNPFFTGNIFNNILPIGYTYFLIIGIFNLHVAFILFTATSFFTYLWAIQILSKMLKFENKIVWTFGLFNLPLLECLDRGAPVLLVTSLFVIASCILINDKTNKYIVHLSCFVAAFCLGGKIYLLPAFLILVLGGSIRFRYFFWTAVYFIAGNLAISYVYNGPINAFKQIVFSLNAVTDNHFSNIFVSVNYSSALLRVTSFFHDSHFLSNNLFTAISVFSFIVAATIVRRLKIRGITLFMSLSMIQYFATVSFVYTEIWVVFGLIILIHDREVKSFMSKHKSIYRFACLVLVLQILPFPQVLAYWLFPSLWFVSVISIFTISLRSNQHQLCTDRNNSNH